MDDYYYVLFSIFAIIIALMVVDQSIARMCNLLSQMVEVYYRRTKWWIANDPRNPIVKWLVWRRSMKLAKELTQKIEQHNKSN
jgi:hypothetical protein